MNLILLSDSDFISTHRVRLSGRRFLHIQDILKAQEGKTLTVGLINGLIGQGTIVSPKSEQNQVVIPDTHSCSSFPRKRESIELEVKFDSKPPQALPLSLILALPRPPMLKRILFSAAMLGVKRITILNFNRVEKSLWNSSSLKIPAMTEQLVLGLEQAKDTLMPEVTIKKGFKPFVQDELPALIKGTLALVAHPDKKNIPSLLRGETCIPSPWRGGLGRGAHSEKPVTLIIGPEGGIIDYEIEQLKAAGCQPMDLGPRILRTETVLPFIVGKLF